MRKAHAIENRRIYDELSELVYGHDNAKKVLINQINRSKLNYYIKYNVSEEGQEYEAYESPLTMSNCLLIGDSGTGKTHLVECLSKVMDFPLVKLDATELNPTGASGGIKKKDLVRLINTKVKEMMQENPFKYRSEEGTRDQMVVFVDEIDKLGQKLSSDWNDNVQSSFLTLFDDKDEFAHVTFIFAGAFTKLEKVSKPNSTIGFITSQQEMRKEADLSQLVIKCGLLPELVGRMHNIVMLDQLSRDSYRKILHQTLLPQVIDSMTYYGIMDFELRPEEEEHLITTAINSGLGVRSLQAGLNKLVVEYEFDPETYYTRCSA